MTTMKITLVFEPLRELPPVSPPPPERLNRFIAAIEQHAGLTIKLVHGFLRDVAPPDGFVFLAATDHPALVLQECSLEQQKSLIPRLVPLEVSRVDIFENLLEALSVPAAVDWISLSEWETSDPLKIGAYGPHGLREIGQLVGATCLFYESERYCYLKSNAHYGLPHLLVDYLRALTAAEATA